jgi:hypothetical protein
LMCARYNSDSPFLKLSKKPAQPAHRATMPMDAGELDGPV